MSPSERHVPCWVLALLVAVMPLSAAHSDVTYVRASDLGRLCNSDNDIKRSWCEGFISSVLEIVSNDSFGGIRVCLTSQTTLQRGVDIAKKWLADHPRESIERASVAVARAFADAFPCTK